MGIGLSCARIVAEINKWNNMAILVFMVNDQFKTTKINNKVILIF